MPAVQGAPRPSKSRSDCNSVLDGCEGGTPRRRVLSSHASSCTSALRRLNRYCPLPIYRGTLACGELGRDVRDEHGGPSWFHEAPRPARAGNRTPNEKL